MLIPQLAPKLETRSQRVSQLTNPRDAAVGATTARRHASSARSPSFSIFLLSPKPMLSCLLFSHASGWKNREKPGGCGILWDLGSASRVLQQMASSAMRISRHYRYFYILCSTRSVVQNAVRWCPAPASDRYAFFALPAGSRTGHPSGSLKATPFPARRRLVSPFIQHDATVARITRPSSSSRWSLASRTRTTLPSVAQCQRRSVAAQPWRDLRPALGSESPLPAMSRHVPAASQRHASGIPEIIVESVQCDTTSRLGTLAREAFRVLGSLLGGPHQEIPGTWQGVLQDLFEKPTDSGCPPR